MGDVSAVLRRCGITNSKLCAKASEYCRLVDVKLRGALGVVSEMIAKLPSHRLLDQSVTRQLPCQPDTHHRTHSSQLRPLRRARCAKLLCALSSQQ
jgi:hypothetical protein